MTGARPPRFSIVTAVYDVAPYLPEFISSIEAQRVGPGDLEVIAVDDGSLDGSLELLTDWARRSRFHVQVLTKPNGGQGSARNLGLEHATGEWVTFTDPDDTLDPAFLRVAETFARRHPDVQLMAGKPILYLESTGVHRDTHPRRQQYRGGNRVADMDEEPNVFPGSTSVSFYRLDRIRAMGLRFDPQVRPNFEDGHFAAHYLFSLERPRVGLLADAHYHYRKRADQTSTLQRSLRDARRYTSVLEHGYLDVVERARERYGAVPPWVQHLLVYELYWYLNEDRKISSGAFIEPDALPRFHELLQRILLELEPEVIAEHRVHRLDPVMADVLARAGRPGSWHSPFVVRTRVDRTMGLRRVQYRFTGDAPSEETLVDGRPVEIAFAKTMAHRFYGRGLVHERILWIVNEPGVELRLDGAPVPMRKRWPRPGHGRRRGRIERWVRRLVRLRRRSASDIGRVSNAACAGWAAACAAGASASSRPGGRSPGGSRARGW